MCYQAIHVGTARTVGELIKILSEQVPADADVDVGNLGYCATAEVWYDKDTNTVILK